LLAALSVLASVWVAWRLIGLTIGLRRMSRFSGPTRREARRAVISFAAITVFWAVVAIYGWAFSLELQPTDAMSGFLAATLIISLVGWIAARLMQPPARLPHSVGICRVLYGLPETPVKPAGRVTGTDRSGAYETALVESIEPPWDTVVGDFVRLTRERLGESIHSIYIRGPIASGTAEEGRAELGGVVVLSDEAALEGASARAIEDVLIDSHRSLGGAEVLVAPTSGVLAESGLNNTAFLIATQSLCVHGADLKPQLPSFGFGPWVFEHAPVLAAEIERVLRELTAAQSPEAVRRTCQRIMRRIVRTGYEAVIASERGYTRDLYPCFEAFRRHHADRADEMWRALEFAVEPTDNKEVITELCEGLGMWVAQEASSVHQRALEAAQD
jgi:uncharacterized protein